MKGQLHRFAARSAGMEDVPGLNSFYGAFFACTAWIFAQPYPAPMSGLFIIVPMQRN
jgi:hypothetical protein